jgi:hypothetical protein
MATRFIERKSALGPGDEQKPNANSIFVDSDTDTAKFGTGASGTTTKEVVDTTSAQTLTNKTLTAAALGAALLNLPVAAFDADGALTVTPGIKNLNKASAGAYTIAAPAADGDVVILVAGTSFAHVVTGTNLFWAGETGGPFNKVTTAAFIGSGAIMIGLGGLWLVVADQIATIGD